MDARYKKLDMDLYMDLQGKFYEKLVIGENVDFLVIFVFIQEESGLNCGFGLKCVMGESVDFSGV